MDEAQYNGLDDYLQMDGPLQAGNVDLQTSRCRSADLHGHKAHFFVPERDVLPQGPEREALKFRFQIPSFGTRHLLQTNASSSLQIGEVLAIDFLSSSILEDGTLRHAKLQLIANAYTRNK